MSKRKRNEGSADITVTPNVAVEETDEELDAAAEATRRRTGANAYVVPDRAIAQDSDIYPGDMVEETGAPAVNDSAPAHAPAPLPHFYMTVDGYFWYRSAIDQILAALPTDEPITWVEVGVFKGQSIAYLAVEVLNRRLDTTIHAVDNFAGWQGVLQGQALRAEFDKNIAGVKEALGDRLQVHAMSSVEAAASFAPNSLDVVWLDADHSYDAVKADIAAWLPKIRAGGTLGGDDWDWQKGGVAKAVTEAFGKARITLGQGSQAGKPWTWWMVKV